MEKHMFFVFISFAILLELHSAFAQPYGNGQGNQGRGQQGGYSGMGFGMSGSYGGNSGGNYQGGYGGQGQGGMGNRNGRDQGGNPGGFGSSGYGATTFDDGMSYGYDWRIPGGQARFRGYRSGRSGQFGGNSGFNDGGRLMNGGGYDSQSSSRSSGGY